MYVSRLERSIRGYFDCGYSPEAAGYDLHIYPHVYHITILPSRFTIRFLYFVTARRRVHCTNTRSHLPMDESYTLAVDCRTSDYWDLNQLNMDAIHQISEEKQ